LHENNLRSFALNCSDDSELQKILEAEKFPEDVSVILQHSTLIHSPLAVRSSSLLEDSQYHPFAGVYETYCFQQSDKSFDKIKCLLNTIKELRINILSGSKKLHQDHFLSS